jgi:hypothetical protein
MLVAAARGWIEKGRLPMTVCSMSRRVISLMPLHSGQVNAYWALRPHRFKALRCGRRFGKTDFAKIWIAQGLVQGEECAWFTPQHMTWSEVYSDLVQMLGPLVDKSSKAAATIRLSNGGRLDFWSLVGEPSLERALCTSACSFVLAGGVHRFVGPEARVGVHNFNFNTPTLEKLRQTYRGKMPIDSVIERSFVPSAAANARTYFRKMGISQELEDLASRRRHTICDFSPKPNF